MRKIKFAPVKNKDKELIFRWRNSKFVKKFLLVGKINYDEHSNWISEKLKNKNSLAWIIIFNKEKIGIAQFKKHKKKTCNAGFYLIGKKYSYLTFFIINLLHFKIFRKLKCNKIESYINLKNINIRKLNKMSGYTEGKMKEKDFIFTCLIYSRWIKSFGYKYFKSSYGKL